jgi:hypothetical protein
MTVAERFLEELIGKADSVSVVPVCIALRGGR